MILADRLNQRENWCLSGGADDADLLWGAAAKAAGHGVIHFSFGGHHTSAPLDEVVRLNMALLDQADEHCSGANKMLHRRWPPKSKLVKNLLRRNWYQVETANSCYAISTIQHGQVAGGTAWAVMMFLIKNEMAACAAYVFDQDACRWFKWNGSMWQNIYEPPKPCGIYAGIGTRKLNFSGRLAIHVLMDYKVPTEDSL